MFESHQEHPGGKGARIKGTNRIPPNAAGQPQPAARGREKQKVFSQRGGEPAEEAKNAGDEILLKRRAQGQI